jgi:ribosome recycling factor
VTDKLDGEMTLEDARELLKKVCADLEPITSYAVRRKRKQAEEGKKRRKKSKKSKDDAGPSTGQ